ncbi:copper chaperone PCu(A)C [Ruegeria sp. HKCCA4633]|uniref:copper chaperone PCu(A)C n=1 Tax=Ruegeria sp. HKCCA4633 TaxID=2682983 RepID=UPI001489A80F|nr:copper chaperone PCu(A)C [Ruegeria sp. HKCCA4633]
MRKRWFAVAGIAAALGLVYMFTGTPQTTMKVSDGRAIPMGASGSMFMVTLNLQNDGEPRTLLAVTSPSGGQTSLMNPGRDGPLVVPGSDTAQLAMDGAHVMLQVPEGAFPEGTYHALALEFDDGTEVVTRILHPEATGGARGMDHSMSNGIAVSPSPTIELAQDPDVSTDGFAIEISVENFEFVLIEDSAPHVDGQGHAHIYLNGFKLGRLYEERFEIGALAPGDYILTVALNSNDHRPYVFEAAPVALTYSFGL